MLYVPTYVFRKEYNTYSTRLFRPARVLFSVPFDGFSRRYIVASIALDPVCVLSVRRCFTTSSSVFSMGDYCTRIKSSTILNNI